MLRDEARIDAALRQIGLLIRLDGQAVLAVNEVDFLGLRAKKRRGLDVPPLRKLEKPVLHYSLYWSHDQRPVRAEMEQAAAESLTALGLERHEALIVAHPRYLHVIANRVHPETGRATNLGLGWIRLSEWAERWERDHGGIRCHQRVKNNARRRSRLPR